jgi:hypothetical protein
MKNLKIGILVFGALGLLGILMSDIGLAFKYDKSNTIMILLAFGAPTVVAAMALAKPPLMMWHAAVALAGFVLAMIKVRLWETLPHIMDVPTGLKLALIGTTGGLVVSILALVKKEAQV